MSDLPHSQYDPRRVCNFPFPNLPVLKHRRQVGMYAAGVLFALGHWIFLDAAILSAHAFPPKDAPNEPIPVHVNFLDWLPGLCSTLGLLVVTAINKTHLFSGSESYGEDSVARKARLFLFFGFTLLASGLAWSISILVLKYIAPELTAQYAYYGYANVAQNLAIMLCSVVLWVVQDFNDDDGYEYSLTI